MKIKSISTTSFGKFENDSKWDEFSPSINVFYGENEAGKSTIFEMIISLLYGFRSTNKEKNLHVNRNTNQLNINGEIEIDGKTVYVERVLKSKTDLKIISDGTQYIYENMALPYSDHVTRKSYEEIYALELSRLTQFKHNTWTEIEDLLLSNYSSDTTKTPKQVLASIEADMNKIKRKSERGNSLMKYLEEERRELFKKKKVIQENLAKVDDYREKLNHIDILMESIKLKKIDIDRKLVIIRKYYPIMQLYKEKYELNMKLKNYKIMGSINEQYYVEQKNQIKKLYVKMDDVSEKISKSVYEKRKLVDRRESSYINENELKEKIKNHLYSEELKDAINILRQKLNLRQQEFQKEFQNAFSESFREEHFSAMLDINYLNIKSLISEIEELNEEIKILKRNKRTSGSVNIGGKIFMMIILCLVGAAVNFFDLGTYDIIINKTGMVLIGISLVTILNLVLKGKNKQLDEEELYLERDEIRVRLVKELNGIKLSSIVEEFIGNEFLTQIINLKKIAENYLELELEYETKNEVFISLGADVVSFVKRHYGICENVARTLDEMLQTVNENSKLQSKVEILNGQLDLLNDQMFDTEKNLNQTEEEVNNMEKILKDSCDGSLEEGFAKLKSIKHWKNRLDELENKIKTLEFEEEILNDFTRDVKEAGESPDFIESYLLAEIDVLNVRINESLVEKTSCEKDIESLLDQVNLPEIESELMHTDEEILKNKVKYDKLVLMHYIISNSDEKFRKENQPDVFKKAGKYLSIITAGKYSDLEILELKEKNTVVKEIYVLNNKNRINVNSTFSKGTLNQIYLSLRLALLDRLDQENELLPICFDELLVNWDNKRLNNTLRLLNEIAKQRQVFIFTCHSWFVEALKKYPDVKIHSL